LYQDIPYYDTTMTSGRVISAINEDCTDVQNAISEKAGTTVHHLATFVISICVAFWRGWKLTLVMIALMPLMAVAGVLLANILTYGSTRTAKAYAEANTVSSQAISNIRTVASFQAEGRLFDKFSGMLDLPRRVSIRISTLSGMAGGAINGIDTVTCALSPSIIF
jgi:ATP-binding cassette, subfamily B (MDR/TAP), member 1